ncbi:uncharacterized protein [Watersipora subatra]|uniref:uncharacterized protein isoform X2 n=1 Tax=Watersipora subatra TaxID=2589382 RepID=UPI00355B8649
MRKACMNYLEHFHFPPDATENFRAKCLHCSRTIGCHSKSKSNLLRHLRDYHIDVLPERYRLGSRFRQRNFQGMKMSPGKWELTAATVSSACPSFPQFPDVKDEEFDPVYLTIADASPASTPETTESLMTESSSKVILETRAIEEQCADSAQISSTGVSQAKDYLEEPQAQALNGQSQVTDAIKGNHRNEAWMNTLKTSAPIVEPNRLESNSAGGSYPTLASRSHGRGLYHKRPTKIARHAEQKKTIEQVAVENYNVSQLLELLRNVSQRRQIELSSHKKKMDLIQKEEQKIINAISSKLGP